MSDDYRTRCPLGAPCTQCGTLWFLGAGRIAYRPLGWIGPCCKPLDDNGNLRDLDAELT